MRKVYQWLERSLNIPLYPGQASEALMSEKVKTVASLQCQVSRLEDSSQEVHTQLSNLSLRLREEQQKVQLAQEETQTLRSKIPTVALYATFVLG